MVLINKAINEVTVKLVYYGPGLCGKTTNLEKIYGNPKLENKGKMISMATETDRTLFFDFMPMELGTIGGQKVRVQLYTVPGQVFYDATRKLVLRGADGVVFVADSQKSMRESNIESLENLKTNLRLNRLDPDKVAIVYQLNKRDLANADSIEDMTEYLQTNGAPTVEASAINGTGVTATLRAAVARILENLKNNVDTSLVEAPELAPPDMSAKAGVTPGSAGTPKLSMKATTPSSDEVMETPHTTIARPEPVPQPMPGKSFEIAFGTAESAVPELDDLPEIDPFAAPTEAESPFGGPDPAAAENPFGLGDAHPESPFAVQDDPDEVSFAMATEAESAMAATASPFGEETLAATSRPTALAPESAARIEIEGMLAGARRVVESLESALEAARQHERALADKLAGM